MLLFFGIVVRVGAGSGVSVRGVYDCANSLVPISRFLVSFTSARDHSLFYVVVVADRVEEEEAYDGSYRAIPSLPSLPSLLSTLTIEDAVAAAVATAFVLLGARGEDTAPRAPRPSSPLSYRTVPSLPSLLSTLTIKDAVVAAAVTAFVLLGEDTAPRAPRPPPPLSYRIVPSLLSALAIEDAAVAAAATTVVLLQGRGRGVAHMMHASPRSFSFTMVQAPHSHDDDMMLE